MGYVPWTQGTRLRRYVGYMPEHPALPPDISATEFVAQAGQLSGLPAKAARERTADVLRHVGLAEERYRPIGGYSTGMRQRVQLAQAIVHDPRLLLLDEPTNGLDPAGRDEMLELIRRTGTEFGIAIVLASHLLGEIEEVCDHLVAIDGGRLLRAAPMAEFTAETGILTVEVEEGRDALAAGLADRGLRILAGSGPADRTVRIALDGGVAVRHRPRHGGGPGPAPGPAGARQALPGGPVPRRRARGRHERRSGAGGAHVMAGGDRLIAPPPPPPAPTGSIYDIGYRGYDGPRLGRRHAFATLFVGGLRATFGLGRSGRAKIVPAFCLALPVITAVVIVALKRLRLPLRHQRPGGAPGPRRHGRRGRCRSPTILVAVQAPELLGRDVRYRVLSLYFSRALLREDYALAKLAALGAAVLALLLVPHVILTVGAMLLTSDVLGALGREAGYWPAILGSTVVTAVATAGVALVIAAFVARRAYATVTIFGVFLVPAILVAVILALELGAGLPLRRAARRGHGARCRQRLVLRGQPVGRHLADDGACPSRWA